MAKQNALGSNYYIDGVDLSGDVASLPRIASDSPLLDVSGVNVTGYERIYGRYDGEMSFTTFFNPSASQQHLTLRAKGSGSDRIASWYLGTAIGNPSASINCKQINYDPTMGQDGSLTVAVQCLANLYGLDFGNQLTAGKRTDTTATNGSSYNNGAATALGLSAYLHVFAFTGTSVTVKVQQSSDNGGGDAFADLLTFTAATAAGTKERKVTATLTTAVEQYLRVVTTGTFSNAIFAVDACRNPYDL